MRVRNWFLLHLPGEVTVVHHPELRPDLNKEEDGGVDFTGIVTSEKLFGVEPHFEELQEFEVTQVNHFLMNVLCQITNNYLVVKLLVTFVRK